MLRNWTEESHQFLIFPFCELNILFLWNCVVFPKFPHIPGQLLTMIAVQIMDFDFNFLHHYGFCV